MDRILRPLLLLISLTLSLPALSQDGCAFCDRAVQKNGNIRYFGFESPAHTTNFFSSLILDESEHFVLKVTRGAFTPFYFLIISKEHFGRVADLPAGYIADLQNFKSKVETFYREVLKTKFVVFEHGSQVCSGGGACVDHLHLHILPFAGEIEGHADLRLPTRFHLPRSITDLEQLKGYADSYLFYQNPEGRMNIYGIVNWVPSQLLRLLIAEAESYGEEYNWRDFENRGDFMANAAQSVAGYQDWKLWSTAEAGRRITQKAYGSRISGGVRPLIHSGSCEGLLTQIERFKSENGAGTIGEFSEWLEAQK